jgi:hypothetical protein
MYEFETPYYIPFHLIKSNQEEALTSTTEKIKKINELGVLLIKINTRFLIDRNTVT